MPVVYLGIGSNLQAEANLRLCVRELAKRFRLLAVSPVYRNKAIGFDGDEFLNAVAGVETELSAEAVCAELERIHELAGRRRGNDAFVSRTLDIDLLLYGQLISERHRLPRPDILEYSFVLRPLAEIAPGLVHPLTGKTMARHWSEFDANAHALTRIALDLQKTPAGLAKTGAGSRDRA